MTFSAFDFLRAGIILNVGIWAYWRYKSRKTAKWNVYKATDYDTRSTFAMSIGWIFVLVIWVVGIIIFPEVYVVMQSELTEDCAPYSERAVAHQTFSVKRVYVPFYYRGHRCAPFNDYISNESDSTLVLYRTEFFNGAYVNVASVDDFQDVSPHSFMKWNEGIANRFEKPYGTWYGYIPDRKKNCWTHSWTLDTREDAIRNSESILYEIRQHKLPVWSYNINSGKSKKIPDSSLKAEELTYPDTARREIDITEIEKYMEKGK